MRIFWEDLFILFCVPVQKLNNIVISHKTDINRELHI